MSLSQEVLLLIESAELQPDIVTFGLLALGCRTMDDARDYMDGLREERVKYVLSL